MNTWHRWKSSWYNGPLWQGRDMSWQQVGQVYHDTILWNDPIKVGHGIRNDISAELAIGMEQEEYI